MCSRTSGPRCQTIIFSMEAPSWIDSKTWKHCLPMSLPCQWMSNPMGLSLISEPIGMCHSHVSMHFWFLCCRKTRLQDLWNHGHLDTTLESADGSLLMAVLVFFVPRCDSTM